jgi:peptide deformylase
VRAKGWNMHGEPVEIEGTELLARCVQHETDHLDGVLFIDRLDPATRKRAMKEIRQSEWFGLAPVVKPSPHSIRPGLG